MNNSIMQDTSAKNSVPVSPRMPSIRAEIGNLELVLDNLEKVSAEVNNCLGINPVPVVDELGVIEMYSIANNLRMLHQRLRTLLSNMEEQQQEIGD